MLQYNLTYGFMNIEPLTFKSSGYDWPAHWVVIGWIFGFSSALAIPIVGVYVLITSPGNTLQEVRNYDSKEMCF